MPAIVHLLSAGATVGDAIVDDVIALDGSHDGAVAHVVVAGADILTPEHIERLGPRRLEHPGPGPTAGWRDVKLLDDLGRLLRERLARHGETALHVHGPHARSLGSLVGAAVGVAVVVDAGDERPAHRLLPPAARTVYTSHGDLDRALERGALARSAALVPPGVDRAERAAGQQDVVVIDESVGSPHLRRALERDGFAVAETLTTPAALAARLVIVGASAHLSQAVCAAVAAGVHCVGIGVPWASDLVGCASFHPAEGIELEALLRLARAAPRRPRKLGRLLGRAARTEALDEIYGGLVGPRLKRHPPRRPSR